MLIIFDLDKTLYFSESLWKERDEMIIRKIAENQKVSEDRAKEIMEEKLKELDSRTQVLLSLGLQRKDMFEILRKSNIEKHLKYDEKLYEVIENISKNNTLVIASNSPTDVAERILKILKIESFFKKIYGAEYFEKSKPNTKIFDIILDEMGFKPENAAMVGDSLKKDILPAKLKGLKGILVGSESKEADAYIEKVYDLSSAIAQIEKPHV